LNITLHAEGKMTLVLVHDRLANTAILYVILMALWSFWRFFRKQKVDSNYSGALAIAEFIILAQAVLGLVIALTGGYARLERPPMHLLYGAVSLLAIPALFLYTRANDRYQVMLVYGVTLVFLAFIIWRLMVTGV
jgi:hypothetical protein